jgi:hypothetical protein
MLSFILQQFLVSGMYEGLKIIPIYIVEFRKMQIAVTDVVVFRNIREIEISNTNTPAAPQNPNPHSRVAKSAS